MSGSPHPYCPDEDGRCVHGEDEICPYGAIECYKCSCSAVYMGYSDSYYCRACGWAIPYHTRLSASLPPSEPKPGEMREVDKNNPVDHGGACLFLGGPAFDLSASLPPSEPKPRLGTIAEKLRRYRKLTPDHPHRCPHCDGPAYVGLNKIECKGRCEKSTRIIP